MKVINWVWIGIAGLTCFVGVGILGNSDGVWQETEGCIVFCAGLILAALASLIRQPTTPKANTITGSGMSDAQCSNCGKPLPKDTNFCETCGKSRK